jgi:hypothetical protein
MAQKWPSRQNTRRAPPFFCHAHQKKFGALAFNKDPSQIKIYQGLWFNKILKSLKLIEKKIT